MGDFSCHCEARAAFLETALSAQTDIKHDFQDVGGDVS
jgi:hypothetical protein